MLPHQRKMYIAIISRSLFIAHYSLKRIAYWKGKAITLQ